MVPNVSAAAAYSRSRTPEQIISHALLRISAKAQQGSEVTTQAGAYRGTNPIPNKSSMNPALNLLRRLASQAEPFPGSQPDGVV
jgi:hypothetical protein